MGDNAFELVRNVRRTPGGITPFGALQDRVFKRITGSQDPSATLFQDWVRNDRQFQAAIMPLPDWSQDHG